MTQKKIDEPNATETYIGEASDNQATSDDVWTLTKIKVIGNVTHISELGQGQRAYNWDDRATYTYEEIPTT